MAEAFTGGVYTDSAVGHPLQTTNNLFIPKIWTSQLLNDLEGSLVLGSATITNRNYEGEFKRGGDVIHIPHFLDTVNDFGLKQAYDSFASNEMDKAALEYIKMTVQKGSSFRFHVDSLHQLQTQAGIDLMSNLVSQRARKTAYAIDALVAQTIQAAVLGKDLNASPSAVVPTVLADFNAIPALHGSIAQKVIPGTANAIYTTIVDMLTELDLNHAPQDRYLIIAPSVRAELLKTEAFIDAAHWGGGAVMPTGAIGQILGVPVMVSNTLENTSSVRTKKLVQPLHTGAAKFSMVMGSTNAISMVLPLAEMQAYQPQEDFTSAVKSRLVYDAKAIRTEQMVVATRTEIVPPAA
ncbi:hypothetical protein E1264_03560 [Actinomadura sp. KC216]|uniref:hypothetical protein n=1 Tax=Actinomadura sp. KC216 TaxID=2530370 RepID=UPI0010480CCD|nr:hypothetical protein [Actinomadura sp. KC216]TDB90915.1 hypothetical protein E1264_03560 [Actinomadura sp. KC216]